MITPQHMMELLRKWNEEHPDEKVCIICTSFNGLSYQHHVDSGSVSVDAMPAVGL
jgi:hypothetical protein